MCKIKQNSSKLYTTLHIYTQFNQTLTKLHKTFTQLHKFIQHNNHKSYTYKFTQQLYITLQNLTNMYKMCFPLQHFTTYFVLKKPYKSLLHNFMRSTTCAKGLSSFVKFRRVSKCFV